MEQRLTQADFMVYLGAHYWRVSGVGVCVSGSNRRGGRPMTLKSSVRMLAFAAAVTTTLTIGSSRAEDAMNQGAAAAVGAPPAAGVPAGGSPAAGVPAAGAPAAGVPAAGAPAAGAPAVDTMDRMKKAAGAGMDAGSAEMMKGGGMGSAAKAGGSAAMDEMKGGAKDGAAAAAPNAGAGNAPAGTGAAGNGGAPAEEEEDEQEGGD